MFLLILDVVNDPIQIFRPEGHYSVSSLPLERFRLNFVVDVVLTGTFQFADPVRNQNVGLQANSNMNVCFNAAARM